MVLGAARRQNRTSWSQLFAFTFKEAPFSNECMLMSLGKYRLHISATTYPFAASRRTFRTLCDRSRPWSQRSTSRRGARSGGARMMYDPCTYSDVSGSAITGDPMVLPGE